MAGRDAQQATIEELLGAPVTVTSGKRTPEKNALVGGAKNSDHLRDAARDIVPRGMSMQDAAAKLRAANKFKKVINEGDHVHISMNDPGGISDTDLMAAIGGKLPTASPAASSGGVSEAQLMAAISGGKPAVAPPSGSPKNPAPSSIVDIIRTAPGALIKGASYIAGLPGDLNSLLDAGANMLTGANISTNTMPTSSGIQKAVSEPFGGFYEPRTRAGRYADTIMQFAPSALIPGTTVERVARVGLPGGLSEAAGEATEGSPYEGLARFGGALAGGAAVGAGRRIAAPKEIIPTAKDLKTAAQASYKEAENAGVIIKNKAVRQLGREIQEAVTEAGVDATLHPKALAAVKRITDVKGNITLKGMDILRRVANGAAKSVDADESRIAHIILDRIDDFVEGIGPGDVLAGNPEAAAAALSKARPLWARSAKGREVENLFERAKNRAETIGGSGYENALRIEFRQLAQNQKRLRRFSQSEQDAIKEVARGGSMQNIARTIGKLAPTNALSILGSLGAVSIEPITGLAVPAAGIAGRKLAEATTISKANAARATVLKGGIPPVAGPRATPELLTALLARQGKEDKAKGNPLMMPSLVGAR
jgi:hypothetical protein